MELFTNKAMFYTIDKTSRQLEDNAINPIIEANSEQIEKVSTILILPPELQPISRQKQFDRN